MVAEPAVHRGGDVDGAIDETSVKREREGEEADWNIAQRERQRERVKCSRSQSGQDQPNEQKFISVCKGQEAVDQRECGGGDDQDTPRA
jgi:hypothetical protein